MTELVAAFPSETAMLDAMARLSAEGALSFDTFGPSWAADTGAGGSPIGFISAGAGVFGAAFILGLMCLSTVSSWGYPVDIGGRPAFSWPAYMPIVMCWGLLFAALGAVGGFFLLGGMLRFWEPVDEADAIRGAMRDQWVLAVRSEDEDAIDHARAVLFDISPLPVDTVSAYIEETPA